MPRPPAALCEDKVGSASPTTSPSASPPEEDRGPAGLDALLLAAVAEELRGLRGEVEAALQEQLRKHEHIDALLAKLQGEGRGGGRESSDASTRDPAAEAARCDPVHEPAPQWKNGQVPMYNGSRAATTETCSSGASKGAPKRDSPKGSDSLHKGRSRISWMRAETRAFHKQGTQGSVVGHKFNMSTCASRMAKWAKTKEVMGALGPHASEWENALFVFSWAWWLNKLLAGLEWFSAIQEPERTGCLARFVQSYWFDCGSLVLVLTNFLFTAYTANIALSEAEGSKPADHVVAGEVCFSVLFSLEILLKLMVHRLYFFCTSPMWWNIFDTLLVVISCASLIMDFAIDTSTVGVAFLRSIRVIKITRVLRVVRVVKVFRDLRMMLDSLLKSILSLLWCIVLLLFLFSCFAILFVQLIAEHVQADSMAPCESDGSPCPELQLREYFGSVQRAMLTLYMATTGGVDWEVLYLLLSEVGPFTVGCLVFCIIFFQVCAFNLLTGMFVEQARKAAQPDKDMVIFEQREREAQLTEILCRICDEHDDDGDGVISWDEFHAMIKDEKMCLYLAALGLEISDARMFFNMLCQISKTQEVPIDMFVQGCMRMRGNASSIDMQAVRYELRVMHQKQAELEEHLRSDIKRAISSELDAIARAGGSRAGNLR